MAHFKVEPITFNVPSGEIRASILGEKSTACRLAAILPGAGYSCKQPLLHFLVQAFLQSGDQVLTVDSLYSEDKTWLSIPTKEAALSYVENDTESLFQHIHSRFPEGIHTLVGHSLGTYSIACALAKEVVDPSQIIWQCPSLHNKWATLKNCDKRALIIIGTADPRYELAAPFLSNSSFIAENADHDMEVPDPIHSIELLKRITDYTRTWINETDVDISQLERNIKLSPDQRLFEHQAALELCDELARAGQRIHE